MKNIKYYLITLLLILININIVYADCTDEEIKNLKKEANKIEITYKHIEEEIEDAEGVGKNLFYLTIKNIPDDVYFKEATYDINYPVEEIKDGKFVETYSTGKWIFEFYSTKCNIKLTSISVNLPRYNPYSENELCEGINGDDFKLCNKYYDYDVSYEQFEQRVKQYRKIHKIEEKNANTGKQKDDIIDGIKKIIKNNKIYIGGSTGIVILIISIIIYVLSRRKRGVLE